MTNFIDVFDDGISTEETNQEQRGFREKCSNHLQKYSVRTPNFIHVKQIANDTKGRLRGM